MNAEYQPEAVVLPQYAYGFIMEVLTQGLYPNKYHVIREYVQNSYDAILEWRRLSGDHEHGQIQIKIASPSIFIYDDGVGMDDTKIDQYRYIGYSEKITGEGVGFRGIGKLSGIAVADKLIVTSSPAGVTKRYQLVFDANRMLDHILRLKERGANVPLNELVSLYTSISEENERRDAHYTLVELYNVRPDSRDLMASQQVAGYLSLNAPVDFSPNFAYREIVDEWLREYVADYDTVPIHLNDCQIFKPFPQDIRLPQMGFLHDDGSQVLESDDNNGSEMLAFFWYCEHARKGQFSPESTRGLRYRVKNFAVGDDYLVRKTLWTSSPHLAFYFFGEIHVCDPQVIPSSTRDDFEHNEARERLYRLGQRGVRLPLNRIASHSSASRMAREHIKRAGRVISDVRRQIDAGQLPREVRLEKLYAIRRSMEEVEKRLSDAPDGFRERGEEVLQEGHVLRGQLESAVESIVGIYDIKDALDFGPDAVRVYDIIMACLRAEYVSEPETYERLVCRIQDALRQHYHEGQDA